MRKIIALILAFSLILSMFACSQENINSEYIYHCLKTEVSYDSELSDESKVAKMFLYGIPDSAYVIMHRATDAHFVDEVALVVCENSSETELVVDAINNHLSELYNDYSKYNPSQIDKIDNAIIQTHQNCVFLCVTGDWENALDVLNSAVKNSPQSFSDVSSEITSNITDSDFSSSETSVSSEETNSQTDKEVINANQYPSLISDSGEVYFYPNNVMRVDNAAYEPYKYFSDAGKNYASVVNYVANQLEDVNVYTIPILTSYGITFPDDVRSKISYHDQGEALNNLKLLFNERVTVVDSYDNMMLHRDEYLYFRTDHHWTQLGAYYTYESFCKSKGVEHFSLEGRKMSQFDGFLGTHYQKNSGKDPMLGNTPDTVYAYHPVSQTATMTFTDTDGVIHPWKIINDVTNYPASGKYNTFAGSDSPFAVFRNPEVTDGASCIVIKESYGNALVPFLVDHYSTIYEIDYRYWQGNLIDFAKENKVNDVIFANNLSMIGSYYLIGKLAALV